MSTTCPKEYWTINELATATGRPYRTVYEWIELGYVQAKSIEHRTRGRRRHRLHRICESECLRVIETIKKGLPVRSQSLLET